MKVDGDVGVEMGEDRRGEEGKVSGEIRGAGSWVRTGSWI